MKFEKSAGGLIITGKKDKLRILLIKDKSGQWSFPKGLLKKDEDEVAGATREIREETGLKKLKVLYRLNPIEYLYKWEGKLIKKSVVYFLFQNPGQKILRPQTEEGIMSAKWFEIDKAKEIIGYPKTNKPLMGQAFAFIQKTRNLAKFEATNFNIE
jgi:8-oxo-dGTP pyrophosphatase MutT (NUDIX family)